MVHADTGSVGWGKMPSPSHGEWSSEMRTGDLSFIPFVQLVTVHVGQAQAQARVFEGHAFLTA